MIDAKFGEAMKNETSEESTRTQRAEKGKIQGEEDFERNARSSGMDRLRRQRSALDARIRAAEARLKTTQRKQETRRKILVGSYYLDKAEKENTIESLKSQMCGYLTRDSDRKLFGFSSSKDNPKRKEEPQ